MSHELTAYAPNGKRITHEYWGRPYMAPAEFRRSGVTLRCSDVPVAPDIHAEVDYDANKDLDGVLYERDPQGRELRWMDEDGDLWAAEDLTFKDAEAP